MSKSKKANAHIFKIRPGVFAYGVPGNKALAVVERGEDGWHGVRGVKPTISMSATQAGSLPQVALDLISKLVG